MASRDEARMGSATAMIPASVPSAATNMGVLPAVASCVAAASSDCVLTPHSARSAALPTTRDVP